MDERERELLSRTGVAPPLWRKHRPLARKIAASYYAHGHERQDIEQEAMIALWDAARRFDSERGAFIPFATIVIKRRMVELLRKANRPANRAFFEAKREYEVETSADFEEDANGQLRLLVERLPRLSELERHALSRSLNGEPILNKRYDNALQRARRKLVA